MTDIPKPAELVQGVTDSAEEIADRLQTASVNAATEAAAATLAPAAPDAAEPAAAAPDVSGRVQAAVHAATDPLAALLDAPAPHGEGMPDETPPAAEQQPSEAPAEPAEPPAFVASPELATTAPALALMRPGAALAQAAVLPMLAAVGLARDLPAAMISGLGPTDPGDIASALVERAIRPLPRPQR